MSRPRFASVLVLRPLFIPLTTCSLLASCDSGPSEPDENDPAACVSGPAAPTFADVAGAYSATVFVGNGIDVLDDGGTLDLTLGADGSVAGEMVVPEASGGPADEDMAGTYTLAGRSITFDQDADTFVRDADWTWCDGVIDGRWTGAGGDATVRLAR